MEILAIYFTLLIGLLIWVVRRWNKSPLKEKLEAIVNRQDKFKGLKFPVMGVYAGFAIGYFLPVLILLPFGLMPVGFLKLVSGVLLAVIGNKTAPVSGYFGGFVVMIGAAVALAVKMIF